MKKLNLGDEKEKMSDCQFPQSVTCNDNHEIFSTIIKTDPARPCVLLITLAPRSNKKDNEETWSSDSDSFLVLPYSVSIVSIIVVLVQGIIECGSY